RSCCEYFRSASSRGSADMNCCPPNAGCWPRPIAASRARSKRDASAKIFTSASRSSSSIFRRFAKGGKTSPTSSAISSTASTRAQIGGHTPVRRGAGFNRRYPAESGRHSRVQPQYAAQQGHRLRNLAEARAHVTRPLFRLPAFYPIVNVADAGEDAIERAYAL